MRNRWLKQEATIPEALEKVIIKSHGKDF
jgi:hypothetical protein